MYIFYWHIQVTFLSAHILWYYFCEWMYVKLLFWTNQNLYWIRERRWFMVQTSHIGIWKHYLDSGHTGIYWKVVVFFTIQFFFKNLKYNFVIIFIQYSMHNINLIRKDKFSVLPDCKSLIVDKYIYNWSLSWKYI